jgi:hypothetical protein
MSEDWINTFIETSGKLMELAIEKGPTQSEDEIKNLMEKIESNEEDLRKFLEQPNIKDAIPVKKFEGDNLVYFFDENKFKSLDSISKKLVIAGFELELIGFYFMGETSSKDFSEKVFYYEKMKILL